jgi:hemerythrin
MIKWKSSDKKQDLKQMFNSLRNNINQKTQIETKYMIQYGYSNFSYDCHNYFQLFIEYMICNASFKA